MVAAQLGLRIHVGMLAVSAFWNFEVCFHLSYLSAFFFLFCYDAGKHQEQTLRPGLASPICLYTSFLFFDESALFLPPSLDVWSPE